MCTGSGISPEILAAFRQFVHRAAILHRKGSVSSQMAGRVVDDFKQFVLRAKVLQSSRRNDEIMPAFASYVARARSIVLVPAQAMLCSLEKSLGWLTSFLVPPSHDLFHVAGLAYDEVAYTELLRWALDPETNPHVAFTCQKLWFQSLGIAYAEAIVRVAYPQSQVYTANGVPDLVLQFDSFVVVVEAKTGTGEHGARGGDIQQTIAYPPAVLEALALPHDFPISMVYLTPDRSSAANLDARLATYLEFAIALSKSVAQHETMLPQSLRWAYSAAITHLATCAVPTNCDIRRVFETIGKLRCGKLSDFELLHELQNIHSVSSLLQSD